MLSIYFSIEDVDSSGEWVKAILFIIWFLRTKQQTLPFDYWMYQIQWNYYQSQPGFFIILLTLVCCLQVVYRYKNFQEATELSKVCATLKTRKHLTTKLIRPASASNQVNAVTLLPTNREKPCTVIYYVVIGWLHHWTCPKISSNEKRWRMYESTISRTNLKLIMQ